ncbi:unnamed protein product [Trypanosoma congolense IL3000]|uniref:WGS project CAEQ00000000 data, annotated contig 1410 n=2 Tax=Trypanosoma congolense (strain IL3000) TaxID=1068625 RepID=F9W611_TRYCI|nr:unnamed protein product [Trypanosoma congolense IL3000]
MMGDVSEYVMQFCLDETGNSTGCGNRRRKTLIPLSHLAFIPPIYLLIVNSFLCTAINAMFNYFSFGRSAIETTVKGWTRAKMLIKHSVILKEPDDTQNLLKERENSCETDHLCDSGSLGIDYNDSAAFFRGMLNPDSLAFESPRVPASVAEEVLCSSLDAVRSSVQQVVLPFHPTYMIVSITKSLIMLLVIQYHFNFRGGWKRLVVCSAANLMSGLLSPLLEYGAGLLLPVDSNTEMKPAPDWEEQGDTVLIARILALVGQLQLESIETVFIQGCTFILFGAVFLPPVLVFCVLGVVLLFWLYWPLWLIFGYLRRLYYQPTSSNLQHWLCFHKLSLTPLREFVSIFCLKVLALFLLQWTTQSSFLLGFEILQGVGYGEAIVELIIYQVGTLVNPLKMDWFHRLCFLGQLLF